MDTDKETGIAEPKPRAARGKTQIVKYGDEWFDEVRKKLSNAIAHPAASKNRQNYIEDVKFSCSDDQWPAEMKRMRGSRPALTFNRLNGVVKQVVGDYRQNKISIKVLPASGEASTGRCADGASTGCPAPAAITALTSRNATAATKP